MDEHSLPTLVYVSHCFIDQFKKYIMDKSYNQIYNAFKEFVFY